MTITAQIEQLADCLEEMKPLFPAHWEELAIFKDKMPLDPQYNIYWTREQHDELVMATLRKDGELIGYWPTFIAPGLHYGSTLTATMDILWIKPEHRGDGSGKVLFDCLKTELKRRGAKIWYAGSKNHKEIEWFLTMLGFEPVERYFALWIGDS
jgi:GNAT superfamily N-acetyltransferase